VNTMKQQLLVAVAISALIAGGAGFFGGTKYQQMRSPSGQTGDRQFFRAGGPNGRGAGFGGDRGGFRPVNGEIIKADDTSITVKMPDGSSKIVMLSEKTQINKSSSGAVTDLKVGEKVAVFGTDNSDGSVNAQSVQLNPMFQMRGAGGTPNQSQKSPDAKEIEVEGSDYEFSSTKITIKKGEKTRIVFKNKDGMHDFVVDELNIRTAVIPSGSEDFVEFTADKTGTYEFYCSVGNHRAMGMKGTIIVQ